MKRRNSTVFASIAHFGYLINSAKIFPALPCPIQGFTAIKEQGSCLALDIHLPFEGQMLTMNISLQLAIPGGEYKDGSCISLKPL